MMEQLKPEAAYFIADEGLRSALIFFDMKEPADIPVIAEPLFAGMNAKVDLVPAMNAEDLKKGLSQLG